MAASIEWGLSGRSDVVQGEVEFQCSLDDEPIPDEQCKFSTVDFL